MKTKQLSFAVSIFVFLLACQFFTPPVADNNSTPSPALETIEPTVIVLPSEEPLPKPLPAGLDNEITDEFGVQMSLVPPGEFTMGDDGYYAEDPVHQVYLDAFYIDIYEITNIAYSHCVDAEGCNLPSQTDSFTRSSYYGNPEFDNYPVIYVNWDQAKTYCEWRGGYLPTEAQWEKAARGTDGRRYPWGEEKFDCEKTNYSDCVGDTVPVGSYESGKSPYGLYDMSGNAWEWTADWYAEDYYSISPTSNPLGPDSGKFRVVRGTWLCRYDGYLRSAYRCYIAPEISNNIIGFRCAKDANS